jgi:hypothetical protein
LQERVAAYKKRPQIISGFVAERALKASSKNGNKLGVE